MCRRPLCRVCFACKAGCRCCPQKATRRDRGGGGGGCEDTRRPRCRATRLASPRFAATPSAAPRPQHLSLLYPLEAPPSNPPRPTRIPCPSPVRHATPLSPPPATRPSLCHPPRTRSCVSPGKHASGWCMEARWASTDIIHARTHTPYHFNGQKDLTNSIWTEREIEREREGREKESDHL